MAPAQVVLNVHEAARLLGVHDETIRRLARNGEIPAFKVGRGWRIRMEALLKWADAQQHPVQQRTVLVADDDASFRTFIRSMLESRACRVIEAANGAEGLAMVDQHAIDAVFLNLRMPIMTGPDFLQKFRRTHETTPVTIVTGYPDGDLMMEAARYGPVTLLVKPIDRKMLLQALDAKSP